MTSLAELRAIEEERIAAERAAITAELEGQRRAALEAEQRARDAAEAKIAAERAEQLQIAREREHAERAARMHVEAAEATERARLVAALEQERSAHELDLRRQEVARKRPTWMVAVTIGAVLAAAALTWFGYDHYRQAQVANEQEALAKREAAAAKVVRDEALAEMDRMDAELKDLSAKADRAIEKIALADDAAARLAAKQALDRVHAQEAELRRQRALAKAAAEKAIRNAPVIFSDECKNSALAKGCR